VVQVFQQLLVTEPDKVFSLLLTTLQSWAGYHALALVLEQFADLEIFLAGGAIRNVMLDIHPHAKDFDFFLHGPSVGQGLAVIERYGTFSTTPFGSPRWYPAGDSEQYCDLIPIARFNNGLWPCENIVDVLNQFDFTGNSLAFDLRTGVFFSPQNGVRDLARRSMRMVRFDYPEEPITAGAALTRNAVLWFRILHYAKLLDLRVEPVTRRWLIANRAYAERVELFATDFFRPHFAYLTALGSVSNES
jgi:hypothetical protein